MTDTDFLASVLSDGDWHSHPEILNRSITERGCGLTVHSRASDLRKRGHTVEVQLRSNANGRTISFYRCVLDEPSASLDDVRDVTGSTVGSSSTSPNPVLTEDPPSPSKPRAFNRDGGVLLVFDEHDQARLWEPDAA